ncbi:MAG: hypothetical protein FJ030_16200 [Chloroflexi bacterium]|nr:hypothetical protein [Chloroflexota bacterium]
MKLEPADLRLRIIPLADALIHELDDLQRIKAFAAAVQKDRLLRHPVIVAELEKQYLVLDGATRVMALRELGCRDVLAQVVDYADESVQLSEWHHVIVGFPANRLLAELVDVDGVTLQPVEPASARRELALRQILGCVVMNNGQHYAVMPEGAQSLSQQAALLSSMVDVYRGAAAIHRTVEVSLPSLRADYPDMSAVIMFPRFAPGELAAIALGESKLPMSITRHVIAGRALSLNVPLDVLSDARSLEEKNAWLDQWVHDRLRNNKVRVYQEPVVIFDE